MINYHVKLPEAVQYTLPRDILRFNQFADKAILKEHVNLTSDTERALLAYVAWSEGFDTVYDLLSEATTDSVVHGICTHCGDITEIEPDSSGGFCDNCEQDTVKSVLILAHLI